MIDSPPMSSPIAPTDVLGYIRKVNVNGVDMFCGTEATFFVLAAEMERYEKECNSCLNFKGGK